MKTAVKVLLIIALALVLAGGGIFFFAMRSLNWDIETLNNIEYETNTFDIEEKFVSISVNLNTADLRLAPSTDGKCKAVVREYEDERHKAYVQGDTLVIEAEQRERLVNIGFFPEPLSVTVYLPGAEYRSLTVDSDTGDIGVPADFSFDSADLESDTGDIAVNAYISGKLRISTDTGEVDIAGVKAGELEIETDTGDISAEKISCRGSVSINTDTGHIDLSDVACGSFSLDGGTGDADLTNVVSEGRFAAACSTGDIHLDGCDGAELRLENDTGDITGSLRSAKIFIVDTFSGDVDVPKTSTGSRCEIISKTGDIEITIGA